mgnify:CR=1 FL=1
MEKITYGIKNVFYALKNVSESGTVTYDAPVALPGAVEVALPPVGDPVKVYADNVVYVKMNVNQGYDGNLNIYAIPDSFSRDVLGMTIDANGALVEDASAVQKDFALIAEFNTDTAKTKRFVLYNCSAGRADLNGATKEETINPQTFSIPITVAPLDGSEYVKASFTGDSTDAIWTSWLSSVYIPALATQYKVTVHVQVGSTAVANALVVCGGKIARTDASGNAYFMQAAGTYDVLVSDGGAHAADTATVTVTASATSVTVTLV